MNKNENSVRIQTSILNPYEKKALVWMAGRLPGWVTSDMLTWFCFLGAVVIAAGYVLTNYSPAWLWLSSLGFVMHWVGDSLNGTIARVRNQSRPLYGVLYRPHHGLHYGVLHLWRHGAVGLHAFLDGLVDVRGLPGHGGVCHDMRAPQERIQADLRCLWSHGVACAHGAAQYRVVLRGAVACVQTECDHRFVERRIVQSGLGGRDSFLDIVLSVFQ